MRSVRIAISVLLAAVPLAAQTNPAQPGGAAGVVKDSETGAPVPRAHVTLGGRYGTTATADGKFLMTGVPPGTYPLTAAKAGYAMPRRHSVVTLQAGKAKTDLEIRLNPTGVIVGRITDADGDPVESAIVEAETNGNVSESRPTDEHGLFRLGGLAPGRYRVKASHSDVFGGKPEIRTDGSVEHHDATTYYPGVIAEEAAGSVVVRPGLESSGVDIQLVRVPFVRVSGKVLGIPRAAENATVTVWKGMGGNGIGVGNDGSFGFWRLDPGKYRLSGEWTMPNGERLETSGVEIEVGGSNIDNIELRFVPPSDIPGHIEYEDNTAKQIAEHDRPSPMTGVPLNIFQMSADAGGIEAPQVAADGAFRIEKVRPGRYWLGLADDKLYVKSMRLGTTLIDGAILDLRNGSGGADLTLIVSEATGIVTGTVQGDSVAGAEVILVEGGEETGFDPRRTTAGGDGLYTFTNVPPGSYMLVATGEDDPATQGNHVLGYQDQMESVTVGVDEKVTKDLNRRVPE